MRLELFMDYEVAFVKNDSYDNDTMIYRCGLGR